MLQEMTEQDLAQHMEAAAVEASIEMSPEAPVAVAEADPVFEMAAPLETIELPETNESIVDRNVNSAVNAAMDAFEAFKDDDEKPPEVDV
jgi:hypothetical protein